MTIIGTASSSTSATFSAKDMDGEINDSGVLTSLIYHESQPTALVPPRPVRQDTGANPNETRPESGDIFSQGDFSGGAGQEKVHEGSLSDQDTRATRYYDSDGVDISTPGKVKLLYRTAEAHDSTTVGRMAQVGGLPFIIDNQKVKVGNGSFPGTWTDDYSPALAVYDIAAKGAQLFAGVNSTTAPLRFRTSGGVWANYQNGGADITLGSGACTRLLYYRGRLIAVGGTNSRSIFEVTGSVTAPSDMNPLPEGWSYQQIFTNGEFIWACAVCTTDMVQSEIWRFGLNSAGTAVEVKGYTTMPENQLIYSGAAYLGTVFLGGGKLNSSGGFDPVIYIAEPNSTGGLDYQKLAEETGSGTSDLSVRTIETNGEAVLFGWSLTSSSKSLSAREGIAIYHLGRAAFAKHLKKTTAAGTPNRITDIMVYKGRILMSVNGDGLFYEDLGTYIPSGQLTTSFGTFRNAGQKTWSRVDAAMRPLPTGASIDFDYATKPFEENNWTDTGSDADAAGAESYTQTLDNVSSDKFSLRMTFAANNTGSAGPELISFSARSDPKPTPEFRFTRTVRIMEKNRKTGGRFLFCNPKTIRNRLMDLVYKKVTLTEPDATWDVRVEDFRDVEPEQPSHDSSLGSEPKEVYYVEMTFQGTRTS